MKEKLLGREKKFDVAQIRRFIELFHGWFLSIFFSFQNEEAKDTFGKKSYKWNAF